jgi:hypothetical protein
MGDWRVIRTIVRGQFANDDCFLKWIGSHPAEIAIAKVVQLPAVSGLPNDPNDQRLYIVYQAAAVVTPNCPNGNPELVTSGGRNGWPTQAEAEAVASGDLAQRDKIAAQVKAANEKAVSPGNIASSIANDASKAIDSATKSPLTYIVGLGVVGVILWKVLK